MSNFQSDIRQQAGYALRRLGVPFSYTFRRTQMAKGQMRSNREQKKPKKDKTKPATPALPFGGAQGKSSIPTPVKK